MTGLFLGSSAVADVLGSHHSAIEMLGGRVKMGKSRQFSDFWLAKFTRCYLTRVIWQLLGLKSE